MSPAATASFLRPTRAGAEWRQGGRMSEQAKSLGQVAYEAWCEEMYQTPNWSRLKTTEKTAWHNVVVAIDIEREQRAKQN